jgi:rubrerythrin
MTKERMIEILRNAYQVEVEGELFYRHILATIQSREARDMFVYLAEQEALHKTYIAEQIRRVAAGKAIDLSGLKGMGVEDRSRFFADSIRKAADISQNEASAIHTGLLLEQNAQAFYREAAEKAGDPDEKELYRRLADWEQVHMRTLDAAYTDLKERIWADNRFAPF